MGISVKNIVVSVWFCGWGYDRPMSGCDFG